MQSEGAYYTIGASHQECQDYARAGSLAGPVSQFALLSDGCSGSSRTDLGARFLVGAAEQRLALFGDYDPNWILRRAAAAACLLGLDPQCLDATLLTAFVVGREIRVSVVGDGMVAARGQDGSLRTWELSDGDAPGYLSYQLDSARLECYLNHGGIRRIKERVNGCLVQERVIELRRQGPVTQFTLPVAQTELLMLFSDGISSFAGPEVNTHEAVEQLCAIKSYCGAFVERRCRRFLRKTCAAKGWSHHDDLSVAGLYLGQNR